MRPPSKIKQEFLKKWIKGLQLCSKAGKRMSFLERKNAIKLSANIAMASTGIATTTWSRAMLTNVCQNPSNKILVEHILGADSSEKLKKSSISKAMSSKKIRCKKILRKSCSYRRVIRKAATHAVQANSIAKRLVKKRTQVLKSLVPGGECMDEFSLIKETLDYILSLHVQVDVMRQLAKVIGKSDHGKGHI